MAQKGFFCYLLLFSLMIYKCSAGGVHQQDLDTEQDPVFQMMYEYHDDAEEDEAPPEEPEEPEDEPEEPDVIEVDTAAPSGGKICLAVGIWKNKKGQDTWCMNNCNHTPPYCPSSRCSCA